MWIASKYGFFSIVKKKQTWEIRARKKSDLENLIKHALAPTGFTVLTTPQADYRWRVVLHRSIDVAGLFAALADTIDYSNFKNMVKDQKDQADKLPAYHRIWGEMNFYQEQQPDGKRKYQWDDWKPANSRGFSDRELELFPDYDPPLTREERDAAQAELDADAAAAARRKVRKMLGVDEEIALRDAKKKRKNKP